MTDFNRTSKGRRRYVRAVVKATYRSATNKPPRRKHGRQSRTSA